MSDIIGGESPRPEPQAQQARSEPKRPSVREKVMALFGFGAAAAGVGAAATGHVDELKHAVTGAPEAVSQAVNPPGEIQMAQDNLEKQGLTFGDPRPSAKHENGVILQHGALSQISYSGSVGVSESVQKPIIREQPRTDGEGKIVSEEDLQKMGINLEDVWMTEVYGGPDGDIQDKKGEPGEWVKFSAKDADGNVHTFYAAQKFAKFDGQKELEMTNPDGSVVRSAFTPISQ